MLAGVGAELRGCTEGEDEGPSALMGIVQNALACLLGVLSQTRNYSTYMSFAVSFSHMERDGCSHYRTLERQDHAIDRDLVCNPSSTAKTAALRLVRDMWCLIGRATVQEQVQKRLAKVTFGVYYTFTLLFSQLTFNLFIGAGAEWTACGDDNEGEFF